MSGRAVDEASLEASLSAAAAVAAAGSRWEFPRRISSNLVAMRGPLKAGVVERFPARDVSSVVEQLTADR